MVFYPGLSGELSALTNQPTGPASAKSSLACRLSQSLPLCAPKSPSTYIPVDPGLTKRGLRFSHPNDTHAAGRKEAGGRPKWFTGDYSFSPAVPRQYQDNSCSLWLRVATVNRPNGSGPSVEAAGLWDPPTDGDHSLAILNNLLTRAASLGAI